MAKTKLKHENIKADFYMGDVTKLDHITEHFDLALDIGCFHNLSQQGKLDYLTQLVRILTPTGFWLLYGFINPGTPQSGPGLAEAEIDLITTRFSLLSRQNGIDRRGRTSTWFLFQKI